MSIRIKYIFFNSFLFFGFFGVWCLVFFCCCCGCCVVWLFCGVFIFVLVVLSSVFMWCSFSIMVCSYGWTIGWVQQFHPDI